MPEWAQGRGLQQLPQDKNILPANEDSDGLAYDAEGQVYVDDAVTDAATAGGPFDAAAAKRVGVCHFPTTARDPWQVHLQSLAHALRPLLVLHAAVCSLGRVLKYSGPPLSS